MGPRCARCYWGIVTSGPPRGQSQEIYVYMLISVYEYIYNYFCVYIHLCLY